VGERGWKREANNRKSSESTCVSEPHLRIVRNDGDRLQRSSNSSYFSHEKTPLKLTTKV
jgi:hypothetical protein